MSSLKSCLALSVVAFICGCYKPPSVSDFPLWRIEISGDDSDRYVKIRLKEGASLDDVVIGDLFEGFLPSVTHKEALGRFGEPMLIRRFGHDVFYYYPVSLGAVEIAHERSVSWGVATVWKLRAFPRDPDPSALLVPSIARYIEAESGFVHLTVLNPNNTPNTVYMARSGEVLYAIRINLGDAEEGTAQETPRLVHGADY